jgi:hypothetical protein
LCCYRGDGRSLAHRATPSGYAALSGMRGDSSAQRLSQLSLADRCFSSSHQTGCTAVMKSPPSATQIPDLPIPHRAHLFGPVLIESFFPPSSPPTVAAFARPVVFTFEIALSRANPDQLLVWLLILYDPYHDCVGARFVKLNVTG